jgi:hypothetical protein
MHSLQSVMTYYFLTHAHIPANDGSGLVCFQYLSSLN